MKKYEYKDGYTYFFYDELGNGHENLVACPTLVNGGYEKENMLFVDDFAYPLSNRQVNHILRKLA